VTSASLFVAVTSRTDRYPETNQNPVTTKDNTPILHLQRRRTPLSRRLRLSQGLERLILRHLPACCQISRPPFLRERLTPAALTPTFSEHIRLTFKGFLDLDLSWHFPLVHGSQSSTYPVILLGNDLSCDEVNCDRQNVANNSPNPHGLTAMSTETPGPRPQVLPEISKNGTGCQA